MLRFTLLKSPLPKSTLFRSTFSNFASPRIQSVRMVVPPAIALGFALSTMALAEEPPTLAVAAEGPVSYKASEAVSTVEIWKALGREHGFKVVFSPLYKDRQVSMDLQAATVADALDRLALASAQFWAPIDSSTIIVSLDTPQSRRTYEPQVVRTFRLENMRLVDAMTTLRSLYGLKHIVADEGRQTLTVRDTAARVSLAADLLQELDVPADEVTVKVQLVTLPAGTTTGDLGVGALQDHLAKGSAQTLIRSDLNIVGHEGAKLEAKERDPKTGDLLAVTLELEAQVHPQGGEITLALDSRLVQVESELEAAQHRGELSPESHGATSAWRVRSGDMVWIELPGQTSSEGVMALALTPTIRRVGAKSSGMSRFVGTETTLLRPSSPKGSPETEAERQAEHKVRERLKARLAEREQTKSE